jgi:membrane protease YdiL (CAAX protease family)
VTVAREPRRRLSPWWLLVLIPGFILVPQFVSLFTFGAPAFEPENGAVRAEVASELVPDLGGAIIAALVIAHLGWWGLVWREPLRTRRWVWLIPGGILVACVLTIGYGNLSAVGLALAGTLLVSTFFTGLSEELMFRGIVLQALRDRTGEVAAAVGSSVLFGATHLLNAIVIGSGAIPQAILATFLGYVLYLTRRVSGGLLLPIVLHWMIDFSLFSHSIGIEDAELGDAEFALILVELVMIVVALAGSRAVNPRPAAVG